MLGVPSPCGFGAGVVVSFCPVFDPFTPVFLLRWTSMSEFMNLGVALPRISNRLVVHWGARSFL